MTNEAVPARYQELFRRVKELRGNSKADAIKAMCLECVGFKYKRVESCTAPQCPLYHVRPYRAATE